MSAPARAPLRLIPATLAASVAAALVAGSLAAGLLTAPSAGSAPSGAAAASYGPAPGAGDGDRPGRLTPAERRALQDLGTVFRHPGQTSDGKPGRLAPRRAQGRTCVDSLLSEQTYQIAPGITIREWDQSQQVTDPACRGPVRLNLLTVDLNAADIGFDYLGPKYVAKRKPLSRIAAPEGVIGAVNGDFFDISDTGAPLGIGVDRERGLLHGAKDGWVDGSVGNATFWIDDTGPHVGAMAAKVKLKQHPKWPITKLNAPTVPPGSIGLYTPEWGWTKGYSVTDGQKYVREVVIVDGKVRSNRPLLSKGRKIKGQVLVGRDGAARQLKRLRVGQRISFKTKVQPGAQVAISGDRPILLGGIRTVINDTVMHPRTALGVDVDGRKLFLLVVDGRSTASRGFTMVELANTLQQLGADDALNLDGGGSSTLYSRLLTGEMGLVNEPSDGQERNVPNGFGVYYRGAWTPPVLISQTPAPTTPPPTTPPPA
ncbi:hypothetical protein DDE18_17560 [Nocardioides gansuensis]|uniref:Phosphodiester glycosidase domain-containing protein n=1 Tax=Nocardioides gansuensis TaxID=2138300 RepID=A0A2T8F7S8_9ACTN|nr:phosphodiester glycosidase family protein [Nocardioides gansuensis]PVG81774.1 hypothetical protein DDE18_17560 [Nocardioides gansuensis]